MAESADVLVAGGGMAGIAAAATLAGSGLRVVLAERRGYLGGRVRSFAEASTGEQIDNGQHLLMGCYHSSLALARRLGTEHLLPTDSVRNISFVDPGGRRYDLRRYPGLPGPLSMGLGLAGLGGLSIADKAAMAMLTIKLRLGGASTRSGQTCLEWLRAMGQTEAAIERFWVPLVLATLNAPAEAASARLLRRVLVLAFLGSATDAALIAPAADLSDIFAGPAIKYIEGCGGRVLLSTAVNAIARQGDGFVCTLSKGDAVGVRAVVVAAPARHAAPLLRPLGAESGYGDAARVEPSEIASLYLWIEGVYEAPPVCALLGTTTQWVFDRRALLAPTRQYDDGLARLTLTISAAELDGFAGATAVVEHCFGELRSAFPSLRAASVVHSQLIREKTATPLFTPHADEARPPQQTGIPGVFTAGDWTQTDLPATIEGAVRSGEVAAGAVKTYISSL